MSIYVSRESVSECVSPMNFVYNENYYQITNLQAIYSMKYENAYHKRNSTLH